MSDSRDTERFITINRAQALSIWSVMSEVAGDMEMTILSQSPADSEIIADIKTEYGSKRVKLPKIGGHERVDVPPKADAPAA